MVDRISNLNQKRGYVSRPISPEGALTHIRTICHDEEKTQKEAQTADAPHNPQRPESRRSFLSSCPR